MKREGRQHGMVRTYHVLPAPINPRPPCRIVNRVDSPPTAGVFTKVSQKPTNHSKFTGKCDRPGCATCHIHAGFKSKDKSKGTHKLRASEAALNYKVISWRVGRDNGLGPVSKLPGSGFSASRILHDLDMDMDDHDYYDDDDNEEYVDDHEYGHGHGHEEGSSYDTNATTITVSFPDSVDNQDVVREEVAVVEEEEEDYYMGFYDVTVVWEPVDGNDSDEGWSLVGGGM